MVDLEIKSDVVPVDEFKDPVKVQEEDLPSLAELQVFNESLIKYRQEMGRLYQVLNNLLVKANEIEEQLSTKRKELVKKYNLTLGQWAIDFEKKELVRLDSRAPAIP